MIKKVILVFIIGITIIFQWIYVLGDVKKDEKLIKDTYVKAKEEYDEGSYLRCLEYLDELDVLSYDFLILKAKAFIKIGQVSDFKNTIDEAIELNKNREDAYILCLKYYDDNNMVSDVYRMLNMSKDVKGKSIDKYRYKYEYLYEVEKTDFSDISYSFIYKKNRFFVAKKNNKWGLINKNGKNVCPYVFDEIGVFSDEYGIFPGRIGSKWSYYSIKGNKYDEVFNDLKYLGPYDDLIVFKSSKGYGYMDKEYKLIKGYFSYASPFYYDLALIKEDKEYIVINKDFEIVLDGLTDVKLSKEGMLVNYGIIVARDDKWYIYNKKGDKISKGYDDIDIGRGGYIAFRKDDLYGYMDKEGNEVIEPRYTYGESFASNIALVKENGKFKYVDSNFKKVYDSFDFAKSFNSYGYSFFRKDEEIYMIYLLKYEDEYENN